MENFTPISGFFGGCLIGLAAIAMLYYNQKICGISGIFSGILPPMESGAFWKIYFIAGLVGGGLLLSFVYPVSFEYTIIESNLYIVIAGVLVGFGSRMGKGCTSGHGVCGMSRLSKRSLVASAIYFITALMTATIIYLLKNGRIAI